MRRTKRPPCRSRLLTPTWPTYASCAPGDQASSTCAVSINPKTLSMAHARQLRAGRPGQQHLRNQHKNRDPNPYTEMLTQTRGSNCAHSLGLW